MSESDRSAVPDPWASVPSAPVPPQQQPLPPGAAPGYGPYPPPAAMPPYYYPGPGYQTRRTNGLAVASLVCGICGFLYFIPAILGIVFGTIAIRQINRERTEGKGMAIAGIVTGSVWLVLLVVIVIAIATAASNSN